MSLLSIFFCGVVAVYVGTAENYKTSLSQLKIENAALESDKAAFETLHASLSASAKTSLQNLQEKYEQLIGTNSDLEIGLRTEQRKSLESRKSLDGLLTQLTGLRVTIENMNTSLESTQEALKMARANSVKDRKELSELTASLTDRIVQVQNMEVQVRRLLEEKTDLEMSFNTSVTTAPSMGVITPEIGSALPVEAMPMPASRGLKGLILEVRGGLATVSIGAADGLNKKDVLHVYRGGDFICDIVVTDVDTNKAAGVLELVQQGGPRIGDTVTSEL